MCSKMFSKVLASCVLFLALSGLTNADGELKIEFLIFDYEIF